MKKFSLFVLSVFVVASDIEASTTKTVRKSSESSSSRSGGRKNSSKPGRSAIRNKNTVQQQVNFTENEKEEQQQTSTKQNTENINRAICDSEYTRCMNKICSNDTLGKCICYEDKVTNVASTNFLDFDGIKVRQGFETFDYAKKQCAQILDKCIDSKRSITEKYKNLVQRDCLMISKEYTLKAKGLSGDLIELKECMKDACTVKSIQGYENFSFPEYSLCFNESYAKFSIDAYCSNIIAKSSAPLGLKQLFLDEMALGREKSCKSMNGTLTNDRKKCYVRVEYGKNKDIIKASKQIAVGEYVECSSNFFGTIQGDTWEKEQKDVNQILSLTATGFNTAGAVLGIAGKNDPIGSIVSSGIDIAEAGANLGLDIKDYKDGKMNGVQMTSSAVSSVLSIGMSAASIGGAASALKAGAGVAKTASDTAKTAGDAAKTAKTVNDAGKTANTAAKVLNATSMAVGAASMITDVAMDRKIDDEIIKEEKNDIIKYAEVDRDSGQGIVNQTLSEKGNCFLNKEWFGTENEMILLLWKY